MSTRQVCQCQVGLFCSLAGLFCVYIRSFLTLVHTSASTTDTATGICVRFKVDTEVDGSGDKALYFAKYLAARALQA